MLTRLARIRFRHVWGVARGLYRSAARVGGRIGRGLRGWRPQSSAPGVNFVGPVDLLNGLGVSSRGYVSSLMHAGVAVNVLVWRDGFERVERAAVSYPQLAPQPINIIHLNLDLMLARQLLDVAPLDAMIKFRHYNILIFYWELASLLPEWAPLLRRFDEIWCASSFMAGAAARACARPVRVVRPALLADDEAPATGSKADFGLPNDRFVFFYSFDAGSGFGRKNPDALVRAYIEEFAEHEMACCVVKVNHPTPDDPQVTHLRAMAGHRSDVMFMDRMFEGEQMQGLFQVIDCYVSPHRSEGLGITILEAMNAGKPVIATPYGGAADLVDAATAMLLSYRLVEVGENNWPYPAGSVWAEPDNASLRAAMRTLFSDRAQARRIGESGHRRVRELFSLEVTSSKIHEEIQAIWAGQERDTQTMC